MSESEPTCDQECPGATKAPDFAFTLAAPNSRRAIGAVASQTAQASIALRRSLEIAKRTAAKSERLSRDDKDVNTHTERWRVELGGATFRTGTRPRAPAREAASIT